jgi:hypothetical protein
LTPFQVFSTVFLFFFFEDLSVPVQHDKKELIAALNPFRAIYLLLTTSPILTCLVVAYALFNVAGADMNTSYLYLFFIATILTRY